MTLDLINDDLVKVLEDEMGTIETGIKSEGSDKVQIVSYQLEPQRPKFLSTLGLSNVSEPKFEWMMEFSPALSQDEAASVLDYYLSLYLKRIIEAPKRGSYVVFPKPTDKVWLSDNTRGLYFTNPVCRHERFQQRMNSIGIIIAWVVPITNSEIEILTSSGWRTLEDYWDFNKSDLHNPYRE